MEYKSIAKVEEFFLDRNTNNSSIPIRAQVTYAYKKKEQCDGGST